MEPVKPGRVVAPGASTMAGGVSRISNTRSTEAMDCCTVLTMREIWRTGP